MPTLIGREKPSKVFERTDLITLMVHYVYSILYAQHTERNWAQRGPIACLYSTVHQ